MKKIVFLLFEKYTHTHTQSCMCVTAGTRGETPTTGDTFISVLIFTISNKMRINCIIYGQKDY